MTKPAPRWGDNLRTRRRPCVGRAMGAAPARPTLSCGRWRWSPTFVPGCEIAPMRIYRLVLSHMHRRVRRVPPPGSPPVNPRQRSVAVRWGCTAHPHPRRAALRLVRRPADQGELFPRTVAALAVTSCYPTPRWVTGLMFTYKQARTSGLRPQICLG